MMYNAADSGPNNPLAPRGNLDFDDEDGGIDLSGLMLFLKRRWKLIIGTATLIAVIAALALMQMTPRYTATASVAVQNQKQQVVNIQDVMSGMTPDAATMETQAAILRSDLLAVKLVEQLRLNQKPEFNPELAEAAKKFSLFDPGSWWGTPAKKPDAAKRTPEQLHAAILGKAMNSISVAAVPRSFLLTITATSEDPKTAADMASKLADIYITDGIDAKYEATRRASEYLTKRVAELRGQAVATDQAAEVYRSRAGLIGSDTGSTIAGQQMSELNSQLVAARAERAAKEAQLNQIRSLSAGGGDGGIEASGAILNSALIQRLREQESEVVRKLAELQATYGERHPRIINANAELRDLRSKIGEEVRRVAASTANDVQIARARESTLASSLGRLEGTVSSGGQASVRLRELTRESDATKSVYEVFLNRLKETNQQVELQTADARIVTEAQIPSGASFPKFGMSMAAAMALGLLVGLALAAILERLDNTIRSAELVERMGGGAALSFIPVSKGAFRRPEDVVIDRPDAMVPEALRTLRSALTLSDVDNPPKVIMLSSSVPGEGKTFTSLGLARVSAQSGARTILVDADMRHPRVHKALGCKNEHGLVQVLSGQISLDEALYLDEATGLYVLTAGHGAANPPDMLRSEHMAQLVAQLRARYDFVVFDCPPFAPLTDSQVISRLVDKMLLVVRWGSTPVPVVQNTIKQIQRVGAPLVGSVLSQVDFTRHAKYGYGDYGYHYSKYKGYYGSAT
ncbi:MAG: polysaccharide biosynthesis tyrosine autokinase [Pseudomonadota bacterium]